MSDLPDFYYELIEQKWAWHKFKLVHLDLCASLGEARGPYWLRGV